MLHRCYTNFTSLQVLHWVPVMFHKYDGVGSSQIESKAANVGGQQQQINGRVIVEPDRRNDSEWRMLLFSFV